MLKQRWVNEGCEFLCVEDPLCLYQLCTIPVGCMWSGFPSERCARDPRWEFYDVTSAQVLPLRECVLAACECLCHYYGRVSFTQC